MGLTQTRAEKTDAMTRVTYEVRGALAAAAQAEGLNIAEAISAAAQLFSSLLAGAYSQTKDREAVIQALPDLVRASLPQWDKIYAELKHRQKAQ